MALLGSFFPPGDKSISHRMILIALVGKGKLELKGLSDCEDVLTTLNIYKQLGGKVEEKKDSIVLHGLESKLIPPKNPINCNNSGTTIRLLTGLLAPILGNFILDGDQQLRLRPMDRVAKPLKIMGGSVETTANTAPIKIEGRKLKGIEYKAEVPSAQVKSAVLFAALNAENSTTFIELTRTRDHTERLFQYCDVPISINNLEISLSPCVPNLPSFLHVPRDPSGSAFFLTAASFIPGSEVHVEHVSLSESRIGFLKVLNRMGANIEITLEGEDPEPIGKVKVTYNGPLEATQISGEEIPSLIDEVPILALAAAMANGTTIFHDVDELRVKEIDRLTAVRHQLGNLGAIVRIVGNDLIVEGNSRWLRPDSLDSQNDHRMAMTLTMAIKALGYNDVPISGLKSAAISYPNFFADLKRLWHD